MSIDDVGRLDGPFDVVLFLGLLYHSRTASRASTGGFRRRTRCARCWRWPAHRHRRVRQERERALVGVADFAYRIPDDAERDGALITPRSADPTTTAPVRSFGRGREVVNATEGGKLDPVPRTSLREALRQRR
jgi:hypothetical protein